MKKVHIGKFSKISRVRGTIQDLEVSNRNSSCMIQSKMKVGLMMNLMKIIQGINLRIRRNRIRIIMQIALLKKKMSSTMGNIIKIRIM